MINQCGHSMKGSMIMLQMCSNWQQKIVILLCKWRQRKRSSRSYSRKSRGDSLLSSYRSELTLNSLVSLTKEQMLSNILYIQHIPHSLLLSSRSFLHLCTLPMLTPRTKTKVFHPSTSHSILSKPPSNRKRASLSSRNNLDQWEIKLIKIYNNSQLIQTNSKIRNKKEKKMKKILEWMLKLMTQMLIKQIMSNNNEH